MECCLLCLELNKELLDYIDTNSKRWQDLGIRNVLEKHFWPLNNLQEPCSWICLSCWQEVEHFHKFYLRIEEAHMNFGRIKIEQGKQLSESKEEISGEIKDLSYYLEPEMLIDQNELKAVIDIKECSIKQEEENDDLNDCPIMSTDPLKKPIITKRKSMKNAKRKPSAAIRSEQKDELAQVKKEISDSDSTENVSDNDDCSYEPDKNSTEYKSRQEDDKFIAEHFKQMFCDLCDAPFENFAVLKKHFLVKHSIQKGYLVCCNRKLFQRNHLVDHLQCHLNPDYFKCTQCGKVLSDRKNLQAHMLRVHRPENVAPKHSCETCGKSFTMAYVLRTHKLKHLPKEEKKFPCTQCGKFYASSYLLKIHTEVIHLKKLAKVCYICGKTLRTSTEYKAHMNKHAGNNGPSLNCDVCGLRLISERSLKLHKESQHPVGGKQDHPCPICEKVSPTARALKKHINTMHEKGFDHKCTMCEKAFRRAEALKEHMASHTGTPLYTCPWCPRTFNSNDLNKELLDYIDTNSKRWQDLGIRNVLEKHFWPLEPCSWICLSCWQEVEHFHKFYLRIEEAHMNFGRIKIEQGQQLSELKEEIKDISYNLEQEMLIDENELKAVIEMKECSIKQEEENDDLKACPIMSTDPLKKPIITKRKSMKSAKSKQSDALRIEKKHELLAQVKKEISDSDSTENVSDNDDCSYEPDKNSIEYNNRKEDDEFIAEHFKQMFCELCDAPFENFSVLKKHFLMKHSIQKGYIVCCNKKLFQRYRLVDHLRCHLNPDYFKCTQCEKVLSGRKTLQAHMLRVHKPENVALKHSCEICGKSFSTAYVLRTHKLKHLPKEEKKFPCTQCGKFYASSYLLRIHTEVIHLKKLAKVCYICGKTLRTSTEYKAHMNQHAGNNGPSLNCDVCGLRLISERSLKLHKESQHPVGGKQDHPCPICDKVSPTARALKKHINTMHEKGVDYKCSVCNKAFRRAEALKDHMSTHTGTPLYACLWCPKTFNSNGNMHAHRKKKHPKECLELKLQKYN